MAEPTRKTMAKPAVDGRSNSEASRSTENGSGASIAAGLIKKLSTSTASPLKPGGPGRLSSIKAERDLTLGASKPASSQSSGENGAKPKRVFQPTIPVRRAKVQQEAPAEQKPPEKSFGGRGRGRDDQSSGRGRGRGRPDIIKSTGTLFGQGASELSKIGGSYRERESSSSSASNLEKPRISSTVAKVDKVEEDEALRMLMRDDFVETGYENVLVVQPTLLPKTKLEYSVKNEVGVDIKMEVDSDVALPGGIKIKQEKMEVDSIPNNKGAQSYERRANKTQVAVKEVFEKEGDIVFIQLPDVLPNLKTVKERPLAIKPAPGAAQEQADDRTTGEAPVAPENIFEDIPEGRMGSLRIHESGKMSLQLGEYSFVLDTATQVSFLQDLISVDVDTEGKTGTMKDLGPIKYKAVCVPNWDRLIVEDE